MIDTLEAARDVLSSLPGVASCKIGLEANMTPDSFPMIRLVPRRVEPGVSYQNRTVETLIYFGVKKTEAEIGLEEVYSQILTMEASIVSAILPLGHRYVDTLYEDNDVSGQYKVGLLRVEMQGVS